jgi:hypothetical protein
VSGCAAAVLIRAGGDERVVWAAEGGRGVRAIEIAGVAGTISVMRDGGEVRQMRSEMPKAASTRKSSTRRALGRLPLARLYRGGGLRLLSRTLPILAADCTGRSVRTATICGRTISVCILIRKLNQVLHNKIQYGFVNRDSERRALRQRAPFIAGRVRSGIIFLSVPCVRTARATSERRAPGSLLF